MPDDGAPEENDSSASRHAAEQNEARAETPAGSSSEVSCAEVPEDATGQVQERESAALSVALLVYKNVLSPVLHTFTRLFSPVPAGCRFLPTCSEYAYVALRRHGLWRGGWLAVWRLLRCHPFTAGGFDPVPPVRRK